MNDLKIENAEWETEPDVLDWIDDATGYKCYIWRGADDKTLRGYVGISAEHPFAGVHYYDMNIEGERSPTFSGYRTDRPGVFWIGYSYGDIGDLVPADATHHDYRIYRNIEFVKSDCRELAKQLYKNQRTRKYARKAFRAKIPFMNLWLSIYRDAQGLIISITDTLLFPHYGYSSEWDNEPIIEYFDL